MNSQVRSVQGALLGMIAGIAIFVLYNAMDEIRAEDQAATCALFSLAGALIGSGLGYLSYLHWRARSESERAAWLDRLEES